MPGLNKFIILDYEEPRKDPRILESPNIEMSETNSIG